MTTIFLWCIVHKKQTKAAAPTGIAAANVEIKKTDVAATTIHNMFDFDGEYHSKLDFAKLTSHKISELMKLEVLLLDEVSMIDIS